MIEIPVIDISPFEERGTAAEAVIDEVRAACEEHGFLVVAGHGIPNEVNEDLDRACRAFFGQSPERKARFTPANGDILRGWWGVGTMATAASLDIKTQPDFMEYLGFGPELSAEQRADYARRGYYPATLTEPEPGRFRRGEHTDYGAVTVLYTDGESGLQVKTRDGRWSPVPVVPHTYIVNLGDLMGFWSNGRWRSSLHRVVCPTDTSTDRLSVPLFFNPSLDALVQCVPTCLAPGEQPAEPIPAGEWIANKVAATT